MKTPRGKSPIETVTSYTETPTVYGSRWWRQQVYTSNTLTLTVVSWVYTNLLRAELLVNSLQVVQLRQGRDGVHTHWGHGSRIASFRCDGSTAVSHLLPPQKHSGRIEGSCFPGTRLSGTYYSQGNVGSGTPPFTVKIDGNKPNRGRNTTLYNATSHKLLMPSQYLTWGAKLRVQLQAHAFCEHAIIFTNTIDYIQKSATVSYSFIIERK